MTDHAREQGVAEAERARAELYDTLTQLRGRLDYAQRIDDGVARAKQKIRAEKRENPLLFGAAVVGIAVACGAAVWAVADRVARAFD